MSEECLSALTHLCSGQRMLLSGWKNAWMKSRKGQLLKNLEAELEKTKRSECDGQTGGSGAHHQQGQEGVNGQHRVL